MLYLNSCNDTNAIFASIEIEEKIESGNLSDNASGLGMIKIGSQYLLATGGAIFYRGADKNTWDRYTLPGEYEGAIKLVATEHGTRGYAVLVKDYYTTPSEYALYEITESTQVAHFSKIRTSDDYMNIWAVEGQDNIFALNGNGKTMQYYHQYQSDSPQLLSVPSIGDADHTPEYYTNNSAIIVDVAYDTVNSQFYLANEFAVFTVDINTNQLSFVDISGDYSSVGYIGGMYYSNLYNRLYVSTAQRSDGAGYIRTLESTAGARWQESSKDSDTFFTSFIDIDQTSFTGVLVGTRYSALIGEDEGYREITRGNITNIEVPEGNKYTSGTLDSAGVLGFFVSDDKFFVLTAGQGLWRGNYGAGRSIDWYLE